MKKVKKGLLLVALLFSGGCTAANRASLTDLGKPSLVVSHAGMCVNFVSISEGRVQNSSDSDGWELTDLRDKSRIRIGGDVIIITATPEQVAIYTAPKSLKEAKADLLKMVQEDGSIQQQPPGCETQG